MAFPKPENKNCYTTSLNGFSITPITPIILIILIIP